MAVFEKIKADNLVTFATDEEAEKAGYKSCSKCLPSEKKEDFLGLVQHLLAYYKLDPKKAYENFMSAL